MKTIIMDLDGTLLTSKKTVTAYTTQVLMNLRSQGHQLVFATARPPRDTMKYIPTALHDSIFLCYNGALALQGGKILFRQGISRENAFKVVSNFEEHGFRKICLEIDDQLYANFDVGNDYGWKPFKYTEDLKNLAMEEALKILVCNPDGNDFQVVGALPQSLSGVVTDNNGLYQMMGAGVTKWRAISQLMEQFGWKREDLIAFGDDFNDMEMIEQCGCGVAMGQGETKLKEVADFVAKSNDEDGVARFLESHYMEQS
jgi:Cof subfamily protein (haloacid dehalogenase superfamily)